MFHQSNKEIIFSEHALCQMKERGFSAGEIIAVLKYPDKTIIQDDNRRKAVKLPHVRKKQYLIIVVYEEYSMFNKIITAFITSKIKKYL